MQEYSPPLHLHPPDVNIISYTKEVNMEDFSMKIHKFGKITGQ